MSLIRKTPVVIGALTTLLVMSTLAHAQAIRNPFQPTSAKKPVPGISLGTKQSSAITVREPRLDAALPEASQLPPQLPPLALPPTSLEEGGSGKAAPSVLKEQTRVKRSFLSRDEIELRRSRCVLTIKQTSFTTPAEEHDVIARFEGPVLDGCLVAAASDVPWAEARVAGHGQVVISTERNPSAHPRAAVITIVSPKQNFVIRITQLSVSDALSSTANSKQAVEPSKTKPIATSQKASDESSSTTSLSKNHESH